jgi:hypothetical protein
VHPARAIWKASRVRRHGVLTLAPCGSPAETGLLPTADRLLLATFPTPRAAVLKTSRFSCWLCLFWRTSAATGEIKIEGKVCGRKARKNQHFEPNIFPSLFQAAAVRFFEPPFRSANPGEIGFGTATRKSE